jgi:single stranded DNA-binding protein
MNKKEISMASVNKVLLLGNLGRDPELRSTPKGNPVLNFSMATTRRWKNRETEEVHDQTVHDRDRRVPDSDAGTPRGPAVAHTDG